LDRLNARSRKGAELATGGCRSRHNRGFTLFEVLVAIVIISIIVTMTTLSIPDHTDKLREETRRLQAVIGLVQEEAILQSRDFGMTFWQQGYAFHEYSSAGKWQKVERDRTLREYKLPEGFRLQLILEGIEVVMSPIEPEKPQVFILSNGEVSPFRLRFKFLDTPGFFMELSADALGTLERTDSEQQAKDAKFSPAKKN
jgi:general secretion pathway protein H